MEKQMPIVAFLYDFDKTLCTTDMQNYAFIPSLGMTPGEFWAVANGFGSTNRIDGILAYMYTMITESDKRGIPLTRESLGVPVIALGVPTVVDAATIAADLLEKSGGEEVTAEKLRRAALPMMVTPRDIDRSVRQLGKVAGYAINWALQDMDISEMSALLT